MRRRDFLRTASLGAAALSLRPEGVLGWNRRQLDPLGTTSLAGGTPAVGPDEVHLVILHTNDTHSRIDPFPMDGGPYQGLGGVARRATLIRRIRDTHPHVLLLDAGDTFQGTPYFNFFRGEIEFRAMSEMGYDASTLGNHDFDNAVSGLVEMLPHAAFPLVSANYEVDDPGLARRVRPWLVREVGGVKVGIFGLGVAFEGLVMAELHDGVRHTDPFAAARRSVAELRTQGCSLVVCLSHLGYRYGDQDRPSDTRLAQEVEGIDLILGGHTHTFMDGPDVYDHPAGPKTLVNQVGFGGIRLGRIDVVLGPLPATGEASAPGARTHGPGPGPSSTHRPLRWGADGYRVDAALD